MELKNKISVVAVVLLLLFLVVLHFLNGARLNEGKSTDLEEDISIVGQGNIVDLNIESEDIIVQKSAFILENITITVEVSNLGPMQADLVSVILSLSSIDNRTELSRTTLNNLGAGASETAQFIWTVPANIEPGIYDLVVSTENMGTGTDSNLGDNEASKTITINSILGIETVRNYAHLGKKARITVALMNRDTTKLNTTLNFYYYTGPENKSISKPITQIFIEAEANQKNSITFIWAIPKDIQLGQYTIWANVTNSTNDQFMNATASTTLKILELPDTEKTPVYTQVWFIVGLISLIIFFLTIIFSLIGVIPQDRLPIQPALVVMALVIMVIALIGNSIDPQVHLIGAQDIAGMVIIHPITALTAGFLVAGGLEAAGAFAAAADALGRIEKLKFRGKTVFGFVGTVVILTNIPTLIAMPCGRILGAALMPAALFFGYRIAKELGDARMVGVVVFAFIVNAAASCGPSPLGGIGTIGEGLSKMPIGSFTTAQSTGIMICTGVCALFMRFITFMRPADLSDEDIRREKEAEAKAKADANAGTTETDETESSSKSESVAPSTLPKTSSKPATPAAVAKPVSDGKADAPVAKKVED